MLPQDLYSCDINIHELRQMMGMWGKNISKPISASKLEGLTGVR